jgi:hypothetical protein
MKILKSEGSFQNLERLENPSFKVNVGFVQTGVAQGQNTDKLVSLGSISYEPLFIFYRGAKPLDLLSGFEGKRLAVGEDGTGTQVLALNLLAMNGIKPGGGTKLLEMDDEEAGKALLEGRIDAAFMMSDSASTKTLRELMYKPGIRLFDFSQADAHVRRIHYLNKIILPKGSLDFGKNIPDHDINLLSPTVELIARSDLHPEAATEVYSLPGMNQKRGEFPGLKSIPALYRWRIRLRILRWYRALLILENDMAAQLIPEKRKELLDRLDQIEQTVNKLKVPASFADQFYSLRSHISIVRERLMNS